MPGRFGPEPAWLHAVLGLLVALAAFMPLATATPVPSATGLPSLFGDQTSLGTLSPHMFTTPTGGNSGEDNYFDTYFQGDMLNATWSSGFVTGSFDLWVAAFNFTDVDNFSQLLTKDVDLSQSGFFPWTMDLTTAQLGATSQYVLVFTPISGSFVFTPSPANNFVSTAFYVDLLDTSLPAASSVAASTSTAQSSVPVTSVATSQASMTAASAGSSSSSASSSAPVPPSSGLPASKQAGVAVGVIAGSAMTVGFLWILLRYYRRVRAQRREAAAAAQKPAFVVLRVEKKPRRGGRGIRSHFWSVVPKDGAASTADVSESKARELGAQIEVSDTATSVQAFPATIAIANNNGQGGWTERRHPATSSKVLKAAIGRKLLAGEVTVVETAPPLVVRSNSGVKRADVHQYGTSPAVELDGESGGI